MQSVHYKSVSEAVNAVKNSTLGHVLFCSPSKVHEMAEQVSSDTVICSVAGEFSPQGFKEDTITGFSYDKQIAQIVPIDPLPALSKPQLEKAYQKVRQNKHAFLLLLCDGLSGVEEKIMTTLYFIDEQFKVIGGSAGDNLTFTETPIFVGKTEVHSVAMFFDIKTRTHLIKENIYTPTGDEMLVTEADPLKRIVKSFNGRPAASEYARVLGVSESELPKKFMNHPLGRVYGNEVFIASPQKINADHSITFYCQIMPNSFVKILKPMPVADMLDSTLKTIPFKPSFMLAINCILRSLKFQQDGLWPTVDKALIGKCSNVTGFVSYGEQYYQKHVNQTMVLLAIE